MISLVTNWHFMRWLRLAIALFLVWQLIQRPDIFTAFVAAFFLFQALTNTGCCGASGCALPDRENRNAESNSGDSNTLQENNTRQK